MSGSGLAFVKGHGTENDFVLIPDRAGTVELTAGQVRAICDRRAGIGADGVIRVAPHPDGGWFMDYRNADGSLAEMCGNGARVFARFLVEAGWQAPGTFGIVTRAGIRSATAGPGGDVRIEMGAVRIGPESTARFDGVELTGTAVDVGNPHLACWSDLDPDQVPVGRAPVFDTRLFPAGVNVEVIRPDGPDRIRMRVHERGSGETRSCGTGTVAAAAVHLRATGRRGGIVTVRVPGGAVQVELESFDGTVFPASSLTGPAVLVADGILRAELLQGQPVPV